MLEKPELEEDQIIACLGAEYGLKVEKIHFLPLGADLNTAVYRAQTSANRDYFVKLRRGEFQEAGVAVPKFLHDQGMKQIIPPLPTQQGQLWARLEPFHVILYPYIEGQDGFERALSDRQWVEFGAALKRFHTAEFPMPVTAGIQREAFSPQYRETVRSYLRRVQEEAFTEPVAVETAAFLKRKQAETLDLVERAGRLGRMLEEQPLEFILCHADIHAWNLLVDDRGAFYMVDWDTLVFAPKERDLMFIGGGLGGRKHSPQEEEALFYQGYGPTRIDPAALAYYRYERIVEDIAVNCDQIFLSNDGGDDRKQALEFLESNFLPDNTIAIARQSDRT